MPTVRKSLHRNEEEEEEEEGQTDRIWVRRSPKRKTRTGARQTEWQYRMEGRYEARSITTNGLQSVQNP